MAYKSLHNTILEATRRGTVTEKAASNDRDEDYDAKDVDELDPHKAKDAKTGKNRRSIKTKGRNKSIAEKPPTSDISEKKDDEDKEDDVSKRKQPRKAKDKVDTTPEYDETDNMYEAHGSYPEAVKFGRSLNANGYTEQEAIDAAREYAKDDDYPDAVFQHVMAGYREETVDGLEEKNLSEKELTDAQEKKKEEIVLELKKKKDEFKEKYGERWEDVMYATATKMAKQQAEGRRFTGKGRSISENYFNPRKALAKSDNVLEEGRFILNPMKAKDQNQILRVLNKFFPKLRIEQGGVNPNEPMVIMGKEISLDSLRRKLSELGIDYETVQAESASLGESKFGKADLSKIGSKKLRELLAMKRSYGEKESAKRIEQELKSRGETVGESVVNEDASKNYDKVFQAVAKHMNVDPEEIDEVDADTRKKLFNMIEKCWDEDNDDVTESCPIEINLNEAGSHEGGVDYKTVYKAVAKHMNLDPETIDKQDKETKKKFFDTLDQCWDAEEDAVPDGCPVDI